MRSYLGNLIIAIAIIIAVFIATTAYKYRFKSAETITATGSAETDFISDQIVWKGTYTRQGFELKPVYAALKSDETIIKQYLNSAGVPDTNIVFSGYSLNGTVTVDSKNIAIVERLSREITGLLEKGIELNSIPPSYYYSKLNELKIDLLAKASQDAKLRAETISKNSSSSLGGISKASMGVFQITGKNSNEDYSYGGVFNTSSKEKTASITLRVEYRVN